MWTPLQNLIPKVAGRHSFAKTLKAIEVCQEYRSLAPKIVHKEALQNTYPKSYDNNVLTIGATSPSWAQKVQMANHILREELAKKYGEQTVKKIRVVVTETLPGNTHEPMP